MSVPNRSHGTAMPTRRPALQLHPPTKPTLLEPAQQLFPARAISHCFEVSPVGDLVRRIKPTGTAARPSLLSLSLADCAGSFSARSHLMRARLEYQHIGCAPLAAGARRSGSPWLSSFCSSASKPLARACFLLVLHIEPLLGQSRRSWTQRVHRKALPAKVAQAERASTRTDGKRRLASGAKGQSGFPVACARAQGCGFCACW